MCEVMISAHICILQKCNICTGIHATLNGSNSWMHLITRCILQRMQGAPRQPSDSSVIGSRFWSQPPLAITLRRYHQRYIVLLIILVAILLERRLGLLSRCLSRSRCRSPMSRLWGFCWKRRRPAWSFVIVRVILLASASSSLTSPFPTTPASSWRSSKSSPCHFLLKSNRRCPVWSGGPGGGPVQSLKVLIVRFWLRGRDTAQVDPW